MDVMKFFKVSKRKLVAGDLGIEIEVEGSRLPEDVGKYWDREHDGSLQGNSAEYVLSRPLSLGDAKKSLDYLQAQYKESCTEVRDTVRAGVHVHVNVQKLTIPQLYNFMTLYSMFEGVLLDYCGAGRNGNLFCLPLNKSPNVVHALRHAADSKEFMFLHDDEYRYCAMNLKSLSQYGSLEFRAMRSTEDLSRVYDWARLLLHLRDLACKYDNPTELIGDASAMGGMHMLYKCLEEFVPMLSKTHNMKRKLKEGIRTSQAIAYSCEWDIYNNVGVDEYEDFC